MSKPRQADWALFKRLRRNLLGAPRQVQLFRWQALPKSVDVFADSDCAGCQGMCRSTSGGVAKWGSHVIETWSSTQATVALSSAEAKLYALTKGAAQALGLMTLLADFGVKVKAAVHTDVSAAIGIIRRSGLGKLCHLNVRYFWLHDQVATGNMALHKVHSFVNLADLVTKHRAQAAVAKHFGALDMWVESGRAESARSGLE